jgi:TRAP-type C4-dicarboxylate transport system permease small subunit
MSVENKRVTFLLEERLLIGILAVQVLFVCVGVLSRYLFNWSFSFTEEVTRYLLVWLACLGFPACWARHEMIQFSAPWEKPKWLETGIGIGVVFLCRLYLVVLLAVSLKNIISVQWAYQQKTAVLGWPIMWVSLSVPLMCVLFLFRSFGKRRKMGL